MIWNRNPNGETLDSAAQGDKAMNYNKAQKEIFNNIVAGNRVCGYWVDEHYFATGNGFHGYIFPKACIAFDVSKVNEIRKLFDFEEMAKPENEMRETQDFRLFFPKTMTRVFASNSGRKAFVNVKYIENFQNAKFYQTEENKPLLVTETLKESEFPVGVVLPLRTSRFKDETE